MNRLLAYLALAVPILAWGLSFPSIKAALTEIPPMTLALGRFVLAAVVLGVWNAWKGPRVTFTRRDWGALIASVVTGVTLYFLCENHGVKLIPASAASLIIASIPILTLLAERVVDGRRLGKVGLVATLVSFLGSALLVGVPEGGLSWAMLWGSVLMFGAALAWVLYLFMLRPLQGRHPNLTVTTWQMVLGALSFVPFAAAELPSWAWPSTAAWGHLAFQGLVCSAASYLLYNYAVERLGLRTASLSVNLIPVVTAVASYWFLGELLGPWQVVGGVLVLAAVVGVGVRDAAKTRETPSPVPASSAPPPPSPRAG